VNIMTLMKFVNKMWEQVDTHQQKITYHQEKKVVQNC
jgi:hypothetical protein